MIPFLRSLAFVVVAVASLSATAARYTGYFEEIQRTRPEAVQSAVNSVTREALANLVGEESWNEQLLGCLEAWISTDLSDTYRPLVNSMLFDVDEAIRNQWAVEGSMRIEMGFLERWLRKQLTDPDCGPELLQRRTVYFETAFESDDGNDELVKAASHVKQLLGNNGYTFVDFSRRQTAEYRLALHSAEFGARGATKTLQIYGTYVDNRVDNQPFLEINTSVEERLRSSELALNKDLYDRQAQSVLAQIREWETSHIVETSAVELVFTSRSRSDASTDELLERIASRFSLPVESLDRPDVLQTTELDNGQFEISIRIPAKYDVSLGRNAMRDVRRLASDVLGYEVAASEFSENGTRLSVFDADAVQAAWEKDVWNYLSSGKLTYPEGRSALAVIQRRLAQNPSDQKALGYLDEVVSRMVQRALFKLGQDALSSANADLALAESIGTNRPSQPWAAARRELDAAIQRKQSRLQGLDGGGAISPAPASNSVVSEPPVLFFPSIESWPTRDLVRVRTQELIGLAAGINGVRSVTLDGEPISFDRAGEDQSALFSIPGAVTYQFSIPYDQNSQTKQLDIRVKDAEGNSSVAQLVKQGGKFERSDTSAASDSSEEQTKKEGDAALRGNYHALIIANEEYQFINDLQTPLRDAEVLKQTLETKYGFDESRIYLIKNGTRDNIELAIDRLQDVVESNDSLLIYFAGHGYQDRGHAGSGYWIPSDGKEPQVAGHRTSWVSNQFVADYVKKVKARHVLLISDSCYAGTFAQRGSQAGAHYASQDFIRKKAGLNSRRAITSGDIEPVLDGGGNGHSIFAGQLLNVLQTHDAPYLTAEQLFREVFKPVTANASQTPQYFVMSENDKGGDFVFVRH
ncbi:MAG: caspase family protein [Pseudomonadota bacterium]